MNTLCFEEYSNILRGLPTTLLKSSIKVKRTVARSPFLRVHNVLLMIFHENIKNLEILICSTNHHQIYDIFHVKHFSQNSKLTLDCSHCDYRALVNKSTVIAVSTASITLSNAHHAQDNLSKLLTTLSSADTLTKNVHKFEGCQC